MENSNENVEMVSEFFRKWGAGFDSLIGSFREYMSEDCLLKQSGIPDLHGVDTIVAWMTEQCRGSGITELVKVECLQLFGQGALVASERVDYMIDAQGNCSAVIPACGIMTIRSGRIVEWHDYFDTALFSTDQMQKIATKSS